MIPQSHVLDKALDTAKAKRRRLISYQLRNHLKLFYIEERDQEQNGVWVVYETTFSYAYHHYSVDAN